MKRKLPALLLAALLLVSLSMTALAEDTPTYGAYNVKAESGYTLTPDGTANGGFYANASAFTLSCPAGTSGEQTLVEVYDRTGLRYGALLDAGLSAQERSSFGFSAAREYPELVWE